MRLLISECSRQISESALQSCLGVEQQKIRLLQIYSREACIQVRSKLGLGESGNLIENYLASRDGFFGNLRKRLGFERTKICLVDQQQNLVSNKIDLLSLRERRKIGGRNQVRGPTKVGD